MSRRMRMRVRRRRRRKRRGKRTKWKRRGRRMRRGKRTENVPLSSQASFGVSPYFCQSYTCSRRLKSIALIAPMPRRVTYKRCREPVQDEHAQGELAKARDYATGGRRKANTIGNFLSSMYLIGRLSAPELQEGCAAATSSSCHDTTVADLAKCARTGKYRANCSRDVISKMAKKCRDRPSCYSTKIPFWCDKKDRRTLMECFFLLPHEIVHWLLERSQDVTEFVGFDNERMQKIFQDWKTKAGVHTDALALGLWGDSATYNTRDSIYMILMNILSGKKHKRFSCQIGCRPSDRHLSRQLGPS